MKMVGVLGIGPQATIEFERRVLLASQRRIPAYANTGYPTMVVYHLRGAPSILEEDGRPILPLRPAPELLDAAGWLGQRCDFLVMPANSPHVHHEAIERAAGCSLLSMVDLTVESVHRRGWRRVGILGFLDSRVAFYRERLEGQGLTAVSIDRAQQTGLDRGILQVMEGRETESDRANARAAVDVLRNRGVDGVILGCTEIPMLLPGEAVKADTVDPIDLLADATVVHAQGEQAG